MYLDGCRHGLTIPYMSRIVSSTVAGKLAEISVYDECEECTQQQDDDPVFPFG
jgi:hypothetical protein